MCKWGAMRIWDHPNVLCESGPGCATGDYRWYQSINPPSLYGLHVHVDSWWVHGTWYWGLRVCFGRLLTWASAVRDEYNNQPNSVAAQGGISLTWICYIALVCHIFVFQTSKHTTSELTLLHEMRMRKCKWGVMHMWSHPSGRDVT